MKEKESENSVEEYYSMLFEERLEKASLMYLRRCARLAKLKLEEKIDNIPADFVCPQCDKIELKIHRWKNGCCKNCRPAAISIPQQLKRELTKEQVVKIEKYTVDDVFPIAPGVLSGNRDQHMIHSTKLRLWMAVMDITQQEFSKLANLKQSQVSRMCNPKKDMVKQVLPHTWSKLTKAFKMVKTSRDLGETKKE